MMHYQLNMQLRPSYAVEKKLIVEVFEHRGIRRAAKDARQQNALLRLHMQAFQTVRQVASMTLIIALHRVVTSLSMRAHSAQHIQIYLHKKG